MRLASLVSGVGALVVLQACRLEKPFERTNPFDEGGVAELSLTGPDSVHSIAQRFTVEIESSIGMPEGELFIGWHSAELQVLPLAEGEFIVHLATARYVPVRLSASLNRVLVGHTVYVGQRARSLEISCAPGGPVTPCDAPPLPVGQARDALVRLYDANLRSVGDAAYALERDGGTVVVSRDAGVAQASLIPDATPILRMTAMGAGSTWIVLAVDDAIDSVRVEVTP